MTFDEYKIAVKGRYDALSEDEKEHIREAVREEHALTLIKILGPELFEGMPRLAQAKKHKIT